MNLNVDWDFILCLLLALASLMGTAWFYDPLLWHLW